MDSGPASVTLAGLAGRAKSGPGKLQIVTGGSLAEGVFEEEVTIGPIEAN